MQLRLFPILFSLCLLTAPGHAQYLLHTWENFESGVIPPSLIMTHNATAENTRVIDLTRLNDPDILKGAAREECGRFAVGFQTDPKQRFLGLVSVAKMDRSRLGAGGKALFQADVYLKGHTSATHTVAVLALAEPPEGATPSGSSLWRMYRFGIISQKKTYFSFTNATPEPQVYMHQDLREVIPINSGWHRIQLVFEGQSEIACYVDGRRTVFSPITDRTFPIIQPGVLITAPEDAPLFAIVDNISIQWTPDPNTPMPESPWVGSSESAALPSGVTIWPTSPEQSWAESKRTGKPLLVMFYNHASRSYQSLVNNVFSGNETAKQNLERFVLLRVDVNQLRGGALASKFTVTRVPTFVVLGPDGRERMRIVANTNPDWRKIWPELEKTLAPQ
ncbi:MAG: Thioredoxin-like [Candidatus Sumerlaeota bacterium]|nr:Thioredoxin-like [Candidatus Sumerlaeota bacterium]